MFFLAAIEHTIHITSEHEPVHETEYGVFRSKIFTLKTSHRMFGHMYGVLNEVYL